MFEPWPCTGGKHLAPATGGSCPCGMVTRIPALKRPSAEPPPEVLAVLAQYLDAWTASLEAAASQLLRELEAAASQLLREQVDRLMAPISTTGLALTAGDVDRLVARRIEAAQAAALACTAPRAVTAREVVTPAAERAQAALSAGVARAPSEFAMHRAEAASATASSHDAGRADMLRPPASGDASAPLQSSRRGSGRDRADGQGRQRARKKAVQKHRQQPHRAKRAPRTDGLIHPPTSLLDDRPMSPLGIFEEHGPTALCEAV